MFQVNDEYDQIDELKCEDKHKLLVKKATKACNMLIKENSELFRLGYRINDMAQELDEMELYFNEMREKMLDRCALIKKIVENPMKLHKIKKNQIQHAIQQEIENEVEEQQMFLNDDMHQQDQMAMRKYYGL